MEEELKNYLINQQDKAQLRLYQYTISPKGEKYPKRFILIRLEKYIREFLNNKSEKRWVIIPGLRGVGKTTALAQIYLKLLKDRGDIHLLYVSLDEAKEYLNADLVDIVKEFERILGKSYEEINKPVFLFLDEVQTDPRWTVVLKSIYDRSKKVFIFCSGSSALELQTNPDVARRASFEKLYPLSFIEYQILKNSEYPIENLKSNLIQSIYYSNNANEVFEKLKNLEPKIKEYWSKPKVKRDSIEHYLSSGTLPFTLMETTNAHLYDSVNILLDKIIKNDIQNLGKFDKDTSDSIKRLLFLLADSDIFSTTKLSEVLDINKLTIARIFEYLEQAELLIRVLPYGANIGKVRKPSKYLFMCPAMRMALFNIAGILGTFQMRMGKLLEDLSAMHFYKEFVIPRIGSLCYDSSQESADFILQIANKRQIAIEVGMGNKGIKQVINTMKNIKCDYGIIYADENLFPDESSNIVKIPLDYFLLM